jgi:hypothetical protein
MRTAGPKHHESERVPERTGAEAKAAKPSTQSVEVMRLGSPRGGREERKVCMGSALGGIDSGDEGLLRW